MLQEEKHSGPELVFQNLILGGGGVPGIAHVGVLLELEKRNLLVGIKRVAGSSIGALFACAFALGFKPEEIAYLVLDIDLLRFEDNLHSISDKKQYFRLDGQSRLTDSFKIIYNIAKASYLGYKNLQSLISEQGLCEGKFIEELVQFLIKCKFPDKDDLTFKELSELAQENAAYKQLYVTGTDLKGRECELFSHETNPDMSIIKAVRISMAAPIIYKKVTYKDKPYADGGCMKNIDPKLFDDKKYNDRLNGYGMNMQTLAVSLSSMYVLGNSLTKIL